MHSQRKERAFVTVNSGNLPPDLLESTLFGHVKGAFTGAVYPKKGLFDLADKGSIFLDEIGNIPLETQAKLLRVMQEREFMRLGGMDVIKVDVRIIAATNVDLKKTMEEGRFREDLFYRLNVVKSSCRRCAIARTTFLCSFSTSSRSTARNRKPDMELMPDALDILMSYTGRATCASWKCHRAISGAFHGRRIGPDLLPDHIGRPTIFQMPRFVVPPEGISSRTSLPTSRTPHRVDARSSRRRTEASGRAAPHQADDAERDDQAVRHSPEKEEVGIVTGRSARRGRPLGEPVSVE